MNNFIHAIPQPHEIAVLPVVFNDCDPEVPLEYCPGVLLTFVITAGDYACPIAHVITPDKGLEAYLYPAGDEFARQFCEKLSMEGYGR